MTTEIRKMQEVEKRTKEKEQKLKFEILKGI
mgnify:CR=1 FL=1